MRALSCLIVLSSLIVAGCGGDKSKGSGDDTPQFDCDKVQPAGYPTTAVGLDVGETLPDQDFTDINDNGGCIRDYTGRVTFISIGTGWCPPCQAETPGFQEVYEEFKDQGFQLIQVLYEDDTGGNPDPEFMAEWQEEYDITFRLVPDNAGEWYVNLAPPCTECYIPHNILLDKDGVIRYSQAGSMPESTLRNLVTLRIDDEPTLDYDGEE